MNINKMFDFTENFRKEMKIESDFSQEKLLISLKKEINFSEVNQLLDIKQQNK